MPNEKEKKQNPIEDVIDGKTYNVTELCKILKVTRPTVLKLLNQGLISHFSICDRQTLVTEKELKRFLSERQDLFSKRRIIGKIVK